ncbi:S66 peptidase family protein [Fodinibius salsisoli]|uniref:LD-carboxypeptidase n=1 Tax=Fodinibius salsisoli TaxID=2820877 RepID=A0ABT3PK45_9BACT|nr:LD-carboxypeptidase [Fodinibius salsisoli]MCW9706312.1 LD-carboxypeptidase [Fodinibius salsisoli]
MDRRNFLSALGIGGFGTLMNKSIGMVRSKEQPLLKPKPLRLGDTIGLVSPASIVGDDKEYDNVVKKIRNLGYKVKEAPHARNKFGYFAGTDKQRAEDLNVMFADPSVDAIMAFRGGWGCNRILEHLDYGIIREHPKALIGYSDITSLLLAIYANTGLTTFHGPVGTSTWTKFTMTHFRKAVNSNAPLALEGSSEGASKSYQPITTLREGRASGRLLGGNLSVLTSMVGSDYLPDWTGSILFLEDVGEDVYRVDRMLTQLKLSGILDQLSGFIFGQCTSCDMADNHRFTLRQILEQHIKPLKIPAFSGAIFGHIDDMMTLPIGLEVEIESERGSIIFQEVATTQ